MDRRKLSSGVEGGAAAGAAAAGSAERLKPSFRKAAACALVALASFVLYYATLLPGVDLGDTGSFQAIAGSRVLTPRQAYPLYFAIANLLVWHSSAVPAYLMNLASAVAAALACGVLVWVAAELSQSLVAGVFAAAMCAVSYTFWTQSIIAEVYALHLLLMMLSMAALVWWVRAWSLGRLSLFFAVYALGFGNHLMMILLLPGFVCYLWLRMPQGRHDLFTARVMALAVAIAALGALQYRWNLSYLWHLPAGALGFRESLAAFWFDITKQDWRETMVFGIPRALLGERSAMYAWDVRQQFGVLGAGAALVGAAWLIRTRAREAAWLLTQYAVTTAFAFTYNVGDVHVFYLPSHATLAILAGCGVAGLGAVLARMVTAVPSFVWMSACLLLPVWRAVDTYPAVDRRRDTRAEDFLRALTRGLDGAHSIFLVDLNWQLENGLSYFARYQHPEITWVQANEPMLYLPKLVDWNREIGRSVAVTGASARRISEAYGPMFEIAPDDRVPVRTLLEDVQEVPAGTPYIFALLAPDDDIPLDRAAVSATLLRLTNQALTLDSTLPYHVVAGLSGRAPSLVRSSKRPFRQSVRLSNLDVEVRMESWLPWETFRRSGFGQVVIEGRHALTLERGVSFGTFDAGGNAVRIGYAFGTYAPQRRDILRRLY